MTDFSELSDEDIAKLERPSSGSQEETPAPAEDHEQAPEEQIHKNPEDELEDASSRGDGTLESVLTSPADPSAQAPSEEEGSEDQTTPHQTEEGKASDGEGTDASAEGDGEEAKDGGEAAPSSPSSDKDEKKAEEDPKEGEEAAAGEVDYKSAYEQIMAPFKANGREIKLESPEEAIRLMQMGANYTKKMQALTPNLKMMRMLQNNDLLDEGKIGFLIDLSKKDPGAILKLLKDSDIDPLDLDKEQPTDYQPGNHKVSDADMAFSTAVEELQSTDAGQELIKDINETWDLQSRQHLAKEPELLNIFATQRQNGLYQQITDEMVRQRTLGTLDPNVPFLTAYKRVGDSLAEQGKLGRATGNPAPAQPKSQPTAPIETRPAAPKKAASKNGDAAKAASPAPKSAVPAPPPINPYEMSDEEIASMKSFKV